MIILVHYDIKYHIFSKTLSHFVVVSALASQQEGPLPLKYVQWDPLLEQNTLEKEIPSLSGTFLDKIKIEINDITAKNVTLLIVIKLLAVIKLSVPTMSSLGRAKD